MIDNTIHPTNESESAPSEDGNIEATFPALSQTEIVTAETKPDDFVVAITDDTVSQISIPATGTPASPVILDAPEVTGISEPLPGGQIELDDTQSLAGDAEFVGEVRRIIREEKDKPFSEEEKSEDLQKKYLSSRFNVDFSHDTEVK